jgi:hypothetical protein
MQPTFPHGRDYARSGTGPNALHGRRATVDDVWLVIDRVDRLDIRLMNGPGTHANERMVDFCLYSRKRCEVEVGWNGMRVEGKQQRFEITRVAFCRRTFFQQPGS